MKKIKVRLTFIDELLGMMPNSKELYREYIASKSPDATTIEDEVAAVGVDKVLENGTTVFPRNENGQPFLYARHMKGYFKETAGFMNRNEKGKSPESGEKKKPKVLTAYKKAIDGCLFVEPLKIPLNIPTEMGLCQRPLRASTPMGERVAIAASETAPEGTTCEFTVVCMDDSLETFVRDWLDYGKYHGTGQWRNSGKGRFVWKELDEKGEVIGGNKE